MASNVTKTKLNKNPNVHPQEEEYGRFIEVFFEEVYGED